MKSEMRKKLEEAERREEEEEEEEEAKTKATQAANLPPPGPQVCRFCGVTFDPKANSACPNRQSKKIAHGVYIERQANVGYLVHYGELQCAITSTKHMWTMEEDIQVKEKWTCCHKESQNSPGCA
ncbi:hypothetical protein F5Y11DRAFT_336161 [Daldinia sp. FL1419]|nr:hypothetical protein F5Y11DRAFT_336161 [Daldinia sp. FL1419]